MQALPSWGLTWLHPKIRGETSEGRLCTLQRESLGSESRPAQAHTPGCCSELSGTSQRKVKCTKVRGTVRNEGAKPNSGTLLQSALLWKARLKQQRAGLPPLARPFHYPTPSGGPLDP